nr:MAG TPA: hypothetical protein [Caudoviricetes sp.]
MKRGVLYRIENKFKKNSVSPLDKITVVCYNQN